MKINYVQNRFQHSLTLIIVLFFSIYFYPQTNLIVDSDFENGTIAWDVWGGATKVLNPTKSGSYAVAAIDNSGVNQTISELSPNTTYLLTGWLKSSNSAAVILGVRSHGGNELTVQTSSVNYVQLSLKFTTGPASTTAIIYGYNPSGGSNTMHIDDLSLILTSETPYQLVWSDEFNQNGIINALDWSFENGFVRNEEEQWYQSNNAFQQDGYLKIEGRKENAINTRLNPNYVSGSTNWKLSRQFINYTSSSIKTAGKQSWLYGRFEIRAKITNQTGTWPAIWTLGNTCEWPSNGEVDIMENYGGAILANFAWGTNTRWSAKWDTVKQNVITNFVNNDPDWLSKFHIWSLDWDENKMSIYLDNVLLNEVNLNTVVNGTANCSGENPFKKKHYLLLNLALGSNGGSVTNLAFPTQYLIDYVKVYQLKSNLAVNQIENEVKIKVYPNPVKKILTIDCLNSKPKYKLYDTSGKVILSGIGSEVDLSLVEKGIYFIKIENLKPIKIIKE
ncbi:family 16 glycosylhydrolase [Flavobacterium sp.]|uniref:family 16 glycosylhydrolase n=1 Tax=Flavobacterium sp. TaxID=239 RepID=UPI00286B20A0|nr:family 16 glycosylhydrolase [Flavobacterium sp.]